jgi:energy-coupling factor transporter ATP-binding protein EcfA2
MIYDDKSTWVDILLAIKRGEKLYIDNESFGNEDTISEIFNIIKDINTKNEALLNMKHDNEFVREYCEYVLTGDIKL